MSKLTGRYNRDLTPHEIDKCKKDTIVFDGDKCVNNALNFCLKLIGEERKTIINNFVEYNLQFHAHNGSGTDTLIILNNLPCDKHIIDVSKNGKGIISLRVFKGYIEQKKKTTPQCLFFRCALTHSIYPYKIR